jgi:hypothetical protein
LAQSKSSNRQERMNFLGGIGAIGSNFVMIEKGHYMIKSYANRRVLNPDIHLTYDAKAKPYRRAKLSVIYKGEEYLSYGKNFSDLTMLATYANRGDWQNFFYHEKHNLYKYR